MLDENNTLAGQDDIFFSTPATNHYLGYNGTTQKWNNIALTGKVALATGGGAETVNALGNRSTATTINLASGNVVTVTLTGNVTFTFSGATVGTACSFGLYITQDSTGNRVVTWPSSSILKWAGGTAPTLSTAANAVDILVFETVNGGSTWYGSLVGTNFS